MKSFEVQYLFFLFAFLLFLKLLVFMFQTENPLPVIKKKIDIKAEWFSLECQKQFAFL